MSPKTYAAGASLSSALMDDSRSQKESHSRTATGATTSSTASYQYCSSDGEQIVALVKAKGAARTFHSIHADFVGWGWPNGDLSSPWTGPFVAENQDQDFTTGGAFGWLQRPGFARQFSAMILEEGLGAYSVRSAFKLDAST